jgi:hypothetical protein
MRTFRVKSLSISGRGNRIYKYGEIIEERHLDRREIPNMVRRGFIEPMFGYVPGEKLKIGIVTAIWKRHELFDVFAHELKSVLNEFDVDWVVSVAGSEGSKSRSIVEKHGFIYTEIENNPLSNKMNAAARALEFESVEYVMCMGSDDFISLGALQEIINRMSDGFDMIGFEDFYFVDHHTQTALYWSGYGNRKSIGAFRCLSRFMMYQCDWMPWVSGLNNRLDSSMNRKTLRHARTSHLIRLREIGAVAFDYKTSENITKFEHWENTQTVNIQNVINDGLIRRLRTLR